MNKKGKNPRILQSKISPIFGRLLIFCHCVLVNPFSILDERKDTNCKKTGSKKYKMRSMGNFQFTYSLNGNIRKIIFIFMKLEISENLCS